MRESAVVAHVATQLRQRNEDFARVRNLVAVGLVTQLRRQTHQIVERDIVDKGHHLDARNVATAEPIYELSINRHLRTSIPCGLLRGFIAKPQAMQVRVGMRRSPLRG